MSQKPTVIIIAGPTASGKTSLSIELANYFHTEIISADSRQCFRELNIGVAKPTLEELEKTTHYFINSHSIQDEVNAGIYEKYAIEYLKKIFTKKNIAVVVGGTGLYIKALCEGIDEMPAIEASTRNEVIRNYEENGLTWLQKEVMEKDPIFWKKAEQDNPQRLMRALEFINQTGISITHFHSQKKVTRDFNIIKIGLEWPRQELYERINMRVDEMITQGLEKEVKELMPFRTLNALQTVGYSEIFNYLDKQINLAEAIEKIKINTRHYAKRQMTWFKKDKDFHWFHPLEKEKILSCIKYVIE
ncbi:MAG TPA: tRNA (adenosine(37)-N6)-dimethylallyltransferase MiaA [Arachidicoccus soli]|nr:tRNA (adenosine(37)-N6)-dimethylallyltransferase MiaA [Arachidicoccus soli]